jgi:hypothetical protein
MFAVLALTKTSLIHWLLASPFTGAQLSGHNEPLIFRVLHLAIRFQYSARVAKPMYECLSSSPRSDQKDIVSLPSEVLSIIFYIF